MSNELFPVLPGLALGSVWSPQFSTSIQKSVSGKEYRSALMANPIYSVKLKYNFLRHGSSNELRTLFGFHLARRGSFDSFLYEHPIDHSVVDQLIGIADGSRTSFQLARSFGSEFLEPVQNLKVVGNVKVGGVTKVPNVDYVVSATGLVVFFAAPLTGNVTWTGSYYYRARFASDSLDFEKFVKDIYTNKKVDLLMSLGRKI